MWLPAGHDHRRKADSSHIHIDTDGKDKKSECIKRNAEEIEKGALDPADRTLKSAGDTLRNIFE